jgi:hypothetical protein
MCIPYDKTFLLVPNLFTLWPWSLTHFSKTLTLAVSFEWQMMRISYACSLWQERSIGTKLFDLVTLTFYPLFKNFNIGHICWMASDRPFIFHMCVSYEKTFLLVPILLTLKFYPIFKNFNIGRMFWMASDEAFIFHTCVPYDKNFLLVPNCLTLWPWSLTHVSKTLTLAISVEWQVKGISYVCSLRQELSNGTIIFYLVTLKFDPLLKTLTLAICFER